MLNKNSIQPLYKQLMDIITQQIKNGTYKPGEKIPPEPELADLCADCRFDGVFHERLYRNKMCQLCHCCCGRSVPRHGY